MGLGIGLINEYLGDGFVKVVKMNSTENKDFFRQIF